MGVEIERKFLVDPKRWKHLDKPAGRFIRQGYILTDPQKTIRVRITGSDAFLTIKGITIGATRAEYEYAIPLKDAGELLDRFGEAILTKTRYDILHEGKTWEADEFHGENEGLLIAEIELESASEQITTPDWVTQEVTGDEKYYNSNLALHPYKQWMNP